MKRTFVLLLGMITAAALAGCSTVQSTEEAQNSSAQTETEMTDHTDTNSAEPEGKAAVVYFSCTGTTRKAAELVAEAAGADLYEILPEEAYTEADLNYQDDSCRANKEQNDPDARPAIENDLSMITEYDVVYLGHPIWWGTNPRIIQTFLESYDLTGAKIFTFCTSGGSGIEKSVSDLQSEYPGLNIISGKRLNNADAEDIESWLSTLN